MITPEEFETAKRLAQEAIGNDPFRVGMAEINCRNSSLRDFMKPQRVLAMLEEIERLRADKTVKLNGAIKIIERILDQKGLCWGELAYVLGEFRAERVKS